MALNKVFLMGNLGDIPIVRTTTTGKTVCSFSLAINEKTGGKESVSWFSVQCWDKTAELASKYLSKGSSCIVEGRLQTQSWEKDGEKRYKTVVVADRLEFVGGKREEKQDEPSIDDIPF